MPKGILFWVLWVIWVFFGFSWHRGWVGTYGPLGFSIIVAAMFFLLGWQNFGFVVH
jgi:hypothetical protein